MGFFDSDEKPKRVYKKKSKEEIYRGLKGKPADSSDFYGGDAIERELQNQILSQYPEGKEYGTNYDKLKRLEALANDLQLNKIRITSRFGSDLDDLPQYMRKGELFDVDRMPKESNPNSFTKFLGRFDPFRSEVPLTAEERRNLPLFYGAERGNVPVSYMYGKLGMAKDFRTGRKGGEELFKDQNLELDRSSNVDPRILNSALLNVNPQTLDELITAPGTGKIRFKALQEKLAKEKKLKDAINRVKEAVDEEEIE